LIERRGPYPGACSWVLHYRTGLAETLDSINTARQGAKISQNHVFAEIPGEKSIADYLEEFGKGSALEHSLQEELTEKLLRTDNEMAMLFRALEGRYVPPGESEMPAGCVKDTPSRSTVLTPMAAESRRMSTIWSSRRFAAST
jgi:hypothetical protein